jgi:hypothetical protein
LYVWFRYNTYPKSLYNEEIKNFLFEKYEKENPTIKEYFDYQDNWEEDVASFWEDQDSHYKRNSLKNFEKEKNFP